MPEQNKYHILLVEDNPGDVRLTQEFIKDNPLLDTFSAVPDGEQAMKYLRCEPPYADATIPNLIILDLNLPKKNGFEVLEEIKTDAHLKHIPVIVLTSSESDVDILKCYDLYANCYISKPVDYEVFVRQFSMLLDFWCRVAHIPVNRPKLD